MNDNEAESSLVMPFVLTVSNGGPYEDAPYVAGWNMGVLETEMHIGKTLGMLPRMRYLSPVDAPQIDLLAMRFGFEVKTTEYSEEWTLYTFSWPDPEEIQ